MKLKGNFGFEKRIRLNQQINPLKLLMAINWCFPSCKELTCPLSVVIFSPTNL